VIVDRRRRSAGLGAALLAGACAAATACAEPPDDGPWTCSREVERRYPVVAPSQVDLLFVIDRSPSMADQADRLAAAAGEWAGFLAILPGGAPDLHVAVVSSDLGADRVAGCTLLGDRARFVDGAACGVAGRFLRDAPGVDGVRVDNHGGDLAAALTCLLDRPPSTCPVSQPLAAAIRALDGTEPDNDGFRRTAALLAVVVISDGDDCSLVDRGALAGVGGPDLEAAIDAACFARGTSCQPADPSAPGLHSGCQPSAGAGLAGVAASRDVLAALAGEPMVGQKLVGGVIAGPAEVMVAGDGTLAPACLDTGGGAVGAAPRLAALRSESFPNVDACATSWLDVLAGVGNRPVSLVGPCLPAEIDLEPAAPGVQAECAVTLDALAGDGERVPQGAVPWCGDPSRDPDGPCYRLAHDPAVCLGDPAVAVDLGTAPPFVYGEVELRCRLACDPAP